ncbi:hypothetical protein DPMN_178304 [Dreissena polymorpha]|uniref:Uncharacterized protein n=1 Tax=Dreissena polymorpha TaxID=45954 RepID=A0A9D4IJR5_DREPO|nr:hypothetical protein DPMN_178304 [Dreissena polymorpha]
MLKLAQTDRPTDQQTDQQTNRQGKNNMSPTTIVGDIKSVTEGSKEQEGLKGPKSIT